jgi:hypothetical protein
LKSRAAPLTQKYRVPCREGHQLLRAFRLTAGSVAALFGIACLLLITRTLIRVGWPAGFKACAYLWAFTLTVPLPISLGVNLAWRLVRWRLFVGWWLIALAAILEVGVLLTTPDLKAYRLDLMSPVVIVVLFLAFLSGGLFLLLIRRRPNDGP